MFNDDEGESNTTGATRYPCMPSLVALQQMRNRLHLAYLGKKLMKWTALATGRELRRLAKDLADNYETFGEDIRDAFILLARARYFYPNLNKIVPQNVAHEASITVSQSVKTVSGVKMLHLEIFDSNTDPYEHLGIEKGGQSIFEAKKAWRDLLKKMIIITEKRIGFIEVDRANRSATKRQNVLIKIVIPRINATIRYILLELEEMAREELYRIKMIQRYKRKASAKKSAQKSEHKCPICAQNFDIPVKQIEEVKETPAPTVKKSEPVVNKESFKQLPPIITGEKEASEAIKMKMDTIPGDTVNKQKLDNIQKHVAELKQLALGIEKKDVPSSSAEKILSSNENKEPPSEGGLDKLVSQINETIKLSKYAKDGGLISESVEDFVKSCEDVKKQIQLSDQEAKDQSQQPNVLDELRFNINDLIQLISKFKAEGLTTESVEKFIKSCESTKAKIDLYEKFPVNDSEDEMLYPTCSQSCTCGDEEESLEELCERCQEMLNEKPPKEKENEDSYPSPECNFCRGIMEPEESEEMICKTCSLNILESPEIKDWPAYVSPELSENQFCELCSKYIAEGRKEEIVKAGSSTAKTETDIVKAESTPGDNSLGYFEKKVRKITKIKRTQNPDGTIREEKETILIRKEKHDPNETTLVEDGEEGEVSYESLLEEDVKQVAICIDPEQNQRGFMRPIRSSKLEDSKSITTMAGQIIRQKNNVVSKVLIPRLIATIRYIQSELEEKEREEIFRLKRFKQFKTKKAAAKDSVTCDVCRKAAKLKKVSSQTKSIRKRPSCKKIDNKKQLDHLVSHINEVIDLTKKYEAKGIVSSSFEEFVKTCNKVKEKIESVSHICAICQKGLEEDVISNVVLPIDCSSTQSIELPSCPTCTSSMLAEPPPAPSTAKAPSTVEAPFSSDSTYNLSSKNDGKLGYFEKKFKEIVKVTRLQNQDGSVSEEKQVITIRTERRNPQKSKAIDGQSSRMDDDDSSTSACGGCAVGKRGYGGGSSGPDLQNSGTRETKSEHVNRSQPIGEPKLRSCMSANMSKSTVTKEVATNFDTDALKNTVAALPKATKSLSNNSVCYPKKCASVGANVPLSGVSSKSLIVSCRSGFTSPFSQVYTEKLSAKPTMEDKETCCSLTPESDISEQDKLKVQTVSTDAIWRDACTSTTGLSVLPSKSETTSNYNNIKYSTEKTETKFEPNETKSCCTIKIIPKPPHVRPLEKDNNNLEVVLKGSMLDAIKSIFLPPPVRSDEGKPVTDKQRTEIQSICNSCLSKMKTVESPQKSSIGSSLKSSTCKICQAEAEEEIEQKIPSMASSNYTTYTPSYTSTAVGSDTISIQSKNTKPKSPTSSMYSKHTCGLSTSVSNIPYYEEQSDDDGVDACCVKGSTPSKVVCCLKGSKEPCCLSQHSKPSDESTPVEKKDASTSTYRSARFDVRTLPLMRRKMHQKNNRSHSFRRSDTQMTRGASRKPVKQCNSFYENEYYFFRW